MTSLKLDAWQQEVLGAKGNIVLRSGRQVGKSTIISIKAAEFAAKNRNKSIMIISAVERQAFLLFSKVLLYLDDNYKKLIKAGKNRPTKSEIKLSNGSVIRCLPTGLEGLGIRGYTIDLLIADEAAFIPQEVWAAVTPMLFTTGGDIILLSTPHGKGGFFYQCFLDEKFTKFHISSEEVARGREEPQRAYMMKFLEDEKERMSKREYAQEYLGEFVDELRRFFTDELIKKCMNRKRAAAPGAIFLGVDVARMGDDQSTFEIITKTDNGKLLHVDSVVTTKTLLNETTKKILDLDRQYDFRKIYMDDGGIGVGVFDYLLENEQTRRKVIALNNRARPLDKDEQHKKKLLKEDLYNNLLALMERGEIDLLDDDDLRLSLMSVQYEYVQHENALTKFRIFSNPHEHSHIVEGLIRAAFCSRDKSLNIWGYSSGRWAK